MNGQNVPGSSWASRSTAAAASPKSVRAAIAALPRPRAPPSSALEKGSVKWRQWPSSARRPRRPPKRAGGRPPGEGGRPEERRTGKPRPWGGERTGRPYGGKPGEGRPRRGDHPVGPRPAGGDGLGIGEILWKWIGPRGPFVRGGTSAPPALVPAPAVRGLGPGEAAARQLASMGCKRLDYLCLTHYDKDHVSGVAGLLARLGGGTPLGPGGGGDGLGGGVLGAVVPRRQGLDIRQGVGLQQLCLCRKPCP